MLGVIVGMLASATPNHRTSVATYWSDETSGMNRPPPTSLTVPKAVALFGTSYDPVN